MEEVSWVALTTVVGLVEPFQATDAPARKPDPFTVSVKAAPPAVAVAGDSEESVGGGLMMVKATAFDGPPPGKGLATVTAWEPADAMSAAVMLAVNCVALTNDVVRAEPPHSTATPETKLLPFTVRVNPAPPAIAVAGPSEEIVGTGFGFTGALIVKDDAGEVLPLANTVTWAVPAFATSAAGMLAVNCVALTTAVLRALPFH